MTYAASITIALLLVLILVLIALLHQQRERIFELRQKLFFTDEALTNALEGNSPRLYSDGMDVRIKEPKLKPWEGFDDPNRAT